MNDYVQLNLGEFTLSSRFADEVNAALDRATADLEHDLAGAFLQKPHTDGSCDTCNRREPLHPLTGRLGGEE